MAPGGTPGAQQGGSDAPSGALVAFGGQGPMYNATTLTPTLALTLVLTLTLTLTLISTLILTLTRYNASTHAMVGTYLNDVHVLDLGAMAIPNPRPDPDPNPNPDPNPDSNPDPNPEP